jgi:hypothetical protein
MVVFFATAPGLVYKGQVINKERGEGGGGWEKGGAFNYFCLNWRRPKTEKYVTRDDPNFLMLKTYYKTKK